jgi:filamentous hemagglutinin family protein
MKTDRNGKTHTLRLRTLAALIPLLLMATPVGAVESGQIAAGNGAISTNGATTTINQLSDRMVINWNNFDIGASEQVQFNQPSSSSAVLNRINSANRTQIDGALNANGQVFVVNPNGVVVGKTGSVTANGVVLSTLDISNGSFMSPSIGTSPYGESATLRLIRNSAVDGAVVNEGSISAGTHGVNLVGTQVINGSTGSIYAKGTTDGTAGNTQLTYINLISADQVNLVQYSAAPTIAYRLYSAPSGVLQNGLVANDGAIKADVGSVLLSVYKRYQPLSPGLQSDNLRNTGSIEAHAANSPFAGQVRIASSTTADSTGSTIWGSYIGGSINADDVVITSADRLVLDGDIHATGGIYAQAYNPTATSSFLAPYGDLLVTDQATQNAASIELEGYTVAMNGLATANEKVEVRGLRGTNVREGALNAPSWAIREVGGSFTWQDVATGSGSNVPGPVDPGTPVDPIDPVDPGDPELPVDPVTPVRQGDIAAGSGTISNEGNTTLVNQQSDRLVINWDSFNIGADETVQFNQPTSKSAVLNRVNSADRTLIDGALNANGIIFVYNPYGVVVGKTGSINANGVVLSTLDVSDNAFMAAPSNGTLSFAKRAGTAGASVINNGAINAGVAGVSLYGNQVVNSATGSISAKSGDVTQPGNDSLAHVDLVARDKVDAKLDSSSGGLVFVDTPANAALANGLVANDGKIQVELGNVTLSTGQGAGSTLRNTGSVQASSTSLGGYLVGGATTITGADLNLGGTIDGSNIYVTVGNNAVFDGAINATNSLNARESVRGTSTVLVSDNASLNSGGSVNIGGKQVTVNGDITARYSAMITGTQKATVRAGSLDAANWTIYNGNESTYGSGSNVAVGLDDARLSP